MRSKAGERMARNGKGAWRNPGELSSLNKKFPWSSAYRLRHTLELIAVLVLVFAACSASHALRVVKIGIYENKPLQFAAEGDASRGLFVDIADSIGRQEGWTIEYVPGSWTRCLERLDRGEIDLMGAIAYSKQRAERFDFTNEVVLSNWGVVNRLIILQLQPDSKVNRTPILFGPQEIKFAVKRGRNADLIEAIDRRLAPMKRQPHSVYYQSLDRWLEVGTSAEPAISRAALWALGGAGLVILLFFAISLLLKYQVTVRTRSLRLKNEALESEIAERARAETALRRSEKKYRALFEGSNDAIVMTAFDGTILDSNPAAESLSGYGLDELKNMNASRLYVNPADRDLFRDIMEKDGAAWDFEVKLRHKDGQERECLLNSSLWKSDEGDVLGFQTILRDITARKEAERALKRAHDDLEERVEARTAAVTQANTRLQEEISEREQAEAALRKSERQLRVITDNIPAYIAYVGMDDLRYSFVNQQFVQNFEVPREEIIGKHIRDIIGESNYRFALEYIERVKSGEPASYVNVFELETGKCWINVNYVPDFDETGKVRAIVVLSHDVTDLKQVEEDLQKKTHDLGERIKELNCLYGISKLAERSDLAHDETFQGVVDLIPPSWQYPDITCARIVVNGREFRTENFATPASSQSADILVHGQAVGYVEVGYQEEKPGAGEGPFLAEERTLLDAIAEQLGRIVDRLQAEEKIREQNQFLTDILASLSYPFYVVNSDTYSIEMANSAAADAGIFVGLPCYRAAYGREELCNGQQGPCPLEEVKKTKRPARVEHKQVTEDGTTKYVDVYAYPIMDRDRNVKQVIEYWHDITEKKQAEEALKTAYRRLNQIIEFLPDPTFVIDRQGRVSAWNRAIAELTGVPSEDIIGKGDYEYALPFYGTRRPLLLDLAREWDESYRDKYLSVKRHDDGVLVSESYHPNLKGGMYLAGTARVLSDADGQPVEAIESLRNITEVKLAEKALTESERRLAQIIEFLPDATMVIDAEGTIIAWNQAMEELTGIEASNMLGKGNYEYAVPFYGQRRPVMIDLVMDYDREAASQYHSMRREGNRLVSETFLTDFQGRGPTWLWNVAAPLYDEEGQVVGAIEVIRDVTDRKQAEEAVRESQEQFALFMDIMPHGVFIKDESSSVIYVNQYMKDLFDAERWIGKDAYEAFPSHLELAEAMMKDDRSALARGRSTVEETMCDKYGNERVFETTKFRIPRGDKPPLLGGIGLDITDRVRAREALRRERRAIQDPLQGIKRNRGALLFTP